MGTKPSLFHQLNLCKSLPMLSSPEKGNEKQFGGLLKLLQKHPIGCGVEMHHW